MRKCNMKWKQGLWRGYLRSLVGDKTVFMSCTPERGAQRLLHDRFTVFIVWVGVTSILSGLRSLAYQLPGSRMVVWGDGTHKP